MSPKRVRLRRTKGWRKPPGAVVVARPSRWGNPFEVGAELSAYGVMHGPSAGQYDRGDPRTYEMTLPIGLSAAQAVELYRIDLTATLADDDPHYDDVRDALEGLRGNDLACWCPLDQPCHADVLLELANP